MANRTTSPRDIGLLKQLYDEDQLLLADEFQRNSVWPRAAKSYLIDTIIQNRPIPLLFFERSANAQTGRSSYVVIDGQQRLRAVFEFLEDEYPIRIPNVATKFDGQYYSELPRSIKEQILNYTLTIEELVGYGDEDIRDMFVRMNRFVVKLSPQELRHAKEQGRFKELVEEIGSWPFWRDHRVFTELQIARFRSDEFAAELIILLQEGPQDKKTSIDLYYGEYRDRVPFRTAATKQLRRYLDWIAEAITNLDTSHYRRPTHLYSLVAALDAVSEGGYHLGQMDPLQATDELKHFEKQFKSQSPRGDAAKYAAAASRQTDNIIPRITRTSTLTALLENIYFDGAS